MWHHQFAPYTSYSFTPCHLLISPPTHHLSILPSFFLSPSVTLLVTPSSSTLWQPLSPSFSILPHLLHLNLTISHPPFLRSQAKRCEPFLKHHLLSVRDKGEGHARRSWHQPVTLPFLLPPSASLLNQITPLTHAHTQAHFAINFPPCSPSLLLPLLFSPLLNLVPFALFICQLPADCVKKHIYLRSNWQKLYYSVFVFVCLDDFACVYVFVSANGAIHRTATMAEAAVSS